MRKFALLGFLTRRVKNKMPPLPPPHTSPPTPRHPTHTILIFSKIKMNPLNLTHSQIFLLSKIKMNRRLVHWRQDVKGNNVEETERNVNCSQSIPTSLEICCTNQFKGWHLQYSTSTFAQYHDKFSTKYCQRHTAQCRNSLDTKQIRLKHTNREGLHTFSTEWVNEFHVVLCGDGVCCSEVWARVCGECVGGGVEQDTKLR